ncbi:MAG: 30S ribosome-binding factor RbfA [Sedimentisphaerales bacterium]|nr:30S ribosome-binding factor RbfA [Sedimentisphaerales bacterium]
MPSRRQEKVARIIKESVSDSIANHLSDPRIEGLISITEVDISPNLRKADVYVSIMAADEKTQNRTFAAIEHAAKHIQTRLGHKMTSKFCPHLEFHQDEKFKKTIETLNLIDEAAKEFRQKEQTEENC